MRRRLSILTAALIGLLLLASVASPQPFSSQIQVAINQLTTGVTSFTSLRLAASSYVNWGTTGGSTGYGLRDSAGQIQVKANGGAWETINPTGTGDLDAGYWVRTARPDLTDETVMGALGTGVVLNATTTGVPSIYAGTTCTNQFVRSLSASAAATCATVALLTDTSGTLSVARGGTALTSGTSGGILAFTASGTLASSGALTASALVLGGGAGAAPTPMASLGTTTTLLHGNATGAPTFGAVSLTADVSGILPVANGGTGTAFFTVSGPATSAKTYTFPNASSTILTSNAAVTAAQGGTGQSSYTVGDLLYASTTTALSKLIDASTGNALISGGAGVAPSYGKIGLTTHVSGTLGATNGGTGLASYTTGDLIYASSATTLAARAAVAAGSYLRAAGTSTAPVWSTATLPNTATTGDLLYASASNTYSNLAGVAVGQVLISGGVGTAPAWSANPRVSTLLLGANLALSSAAPTISANFGTGASVTAGTAASFRINVGTGGTATEGTIGLPTATTGWNCHVEDLTATTANASDRRTVQLSSTTTSATVENQTISTGAALAWSASDILAGTCVAY